MKCIKCGNSDPYACDSCKRFFCAQCAELTASEIKCLQLKGKRKLIFLCQDCESGFWKVPSIIKELNELKEQIGKLSNQIKDLQRNDQIRKDEQPNKVEPTPGMSNEIFEEIYERESRKKNIIVFGKPEIRQLSNTQNSFQEEKTTTLDIIKSVCPNLDIKVDDIQLYRLGRPNEVKPRPVKVIFSSNNIASTIISQAKHLKTSQQFSHISISSDKTPRQMEDYRRIKQQLNERIQAGESNIKIKHINGIPKIVNSTTTQRHLN